MRKQFITHCSGAVIDQLDSGTVLDSNLTTETRQNYINTEILEVLE